jgi:hypothetical protein
MKFDMSEAWRQATAMIAGNREVLGVVAGLFFFLPTVAMGFAFGDQQRAAVANLEAAQKQMLEMYANWWWLLLVVVLFSILGYLTLLALLRDRNRPTVGQALGTALAGVIPAIVAYAIFIFALSVVVGILLAIGGVTGSVAISTIAIVLGIALCFYGGVKMSLAGPVIAIEKVMNPVRVLARSWSLTRGNGLRLLVFYGLLLLVYFVILVVVSIVVGALTVALGQSTGLIVNALLTGLLSAVATTVFVAILAAVHRQLTGAPAETLGQTFE